MVDPRPSTSEEQTALVPLGSRSSSILQEVEHPLQLDAETGTTDVKLFATQCVVHVGTKNDVIYNIVLNKRSCVASLKEAISVPESTQKPPDNRSGVVFTGIRYLTGSSRWYYWLAALVAASCLGSIAAAVAFAVTNLWMPAEQDVSDTLSALQRAFCFMVIPLVTLSCINLVSTTMLSLSWVREAPTALNPSVPPTTNEERDLVEHLPRDVRLMRRQFWRARPPREVLDDNLMPVSTVVVCHTATRSPTDTDEIARDIQGFQRFHFEERFLDDISYNFLIGADGNVYEGRGWTKVPGHARGRERGTLAIAIIGNFVHDLPTVGQLDVLRRFLECGVVLGKLSEDFRLLAHCQVMNTASPGRALLDNIVTWPMFDHSEPINCASN